MPGATGIAFPDPGTFCQAANSLWHQTRDPDAEMYILLTEKNRNLVATTTIQQRLRNKTSPSRTGAQKCQTVKNNNMQTF